MSIQDALKEAGSRPAKDIAQDYGISSNYLRSAASRRGISLAYSLVNVVKKSWTNKEEQFLKLNAQCMTAKEIGKHLNRTEVGIKSKAKQLAEKMDLDYSYVQCILKYRIRRNG
ncbi:hypothetical protein [Vibrio sp. Isolate30]|uniref:hypothetical protein n=1 Tax=Vibrio sp. Isolate30 TaxID=2908536 RepID=UPI001EFCC743|nr:hypothetical protein [Vibrio sp. Isolate30]MCG9631667.1 hypothetical protein [Vibrio sp. Isolate30]